MSIATGYGFGHRLCEVLGLTGKVKSLAVALRVTIDEPVVAVVTVEQLIEHDKADALAALIAECEPTIAIEDAK